MSSFVFMFSYFINPVFILAVNSWLVKRNTLTYMFTVPYFLASYSFCLVSIFIQPENFFYCFSIS